MSRKNIGGILILAIFWFGFLMRPFSVFAYPDCSQYGFMAQYDFLSGGCKCGYGYVLGKDFLGKTTCVSGDSVCRDKYGYGARYDSFNESCECSSGYVFAKDSIGRTQCVSEIQACRDQFGINARSTFGGKCECSSGYGFQTNILGKKECVRLDEICQDNYGFNAKYDSLKDRCSCGYGYELSDSTYGTGLQCVSCSEKYGFHSSYDSISEKCECDDGYTLNESGECVEKQNNVYFTLKEIDEDNGKAIIKSDFDGRYYLIEYRFGCPSFLWYLDHQIVVNLGTDFSLDRGDKIVLQNNNQTCDISSVDRASSSTTLNQEDNENTIYIPAPSIAPPSPKITTVPPTPIIKSPPDVVKTTPPVVDAPPRQSAPELQAKKEFVLDEKKKVVFLPTQTGVLKTGANLRKCPSATNCEIQFSLEAETKVELSGSYNDEEWYSVNTLKGAQTTSGWMHSSVIRKEENDKPLEQGAVGEPDTSEQHSDESKPKGEEKVSVLSRITNLFKRLFSKDNKTR